MTDKRRTTEGLVINLTEAKAYDGFCSAESG